MARAAKEIATVEKKLSIPAHLVNRMQEDAGKGLSKDQADNVVPLVYVLQALSPQVQKRNSSYLEGAEAGCIWLRNSDDPIVSGEEGILFQPCFFNKDIVEWIPRDSGGGFVGRHKVLPTQAKAVEDPKGRRTRFVMPNDNELRETRYHFGYVYEHGGQPMPYVIPMSGSGHQVSKAWMTLMNSKGEFPSWAHVCRIRTRLNVNNLGEWFGWDISIERWANEDEYDLGKKLFASLSAGQRQAEDPLQDDEAISSSRL
jgi:hypothetical protein